MGNLDRIRWGEDKVTRLSLDRVIMSWLGPGKLPE
jgi:hypothetical protein